MTFPVVTWRATGRTTASNTTSHAITLPTGIVAGELLLVVFSTDGNPTVTAPADWQKLGQASNGTTVTGAVFYKTAAGSDTLTITTSASEQSSHVSFRFAPGNYVLGANANGSSTNSNPPTLALTATDVLWIATRSGDSTVVATVAPTNYANLQTIAAAGTGGASTNTAERSLNAASEDPGTFTSATEQWVSWTIAVSFVQPEADLSPVWSTVTAVEADLSPDFNLYGEAAGGNPWFDRTTDSYNTWAVVGTSTLPVEASLSATYQVAGSVEASLVAAYDLGEGASTTDWSWFAISTGGAATWAGDPIDPGTGLIDGAVYFPILVEQIYAGTWSTLTSADAARAAIYQVTNAAQADLAPVFTVNGTAVQSQSVAYSILASVAANLAPIYQVRGSAEADIAPEYIVFGTVSADLSPTYGIDTTPLSAGANFDAAYDVIAAVERDQVGAFDILAATSPAELSASWHVLLPVQDEFEAIWQLVVYPEADLVGTYAILGSMAAGRITHRTWSQPITHRRWGSRITQG